MLKKIRIALLTMLAMALFASTVSAMTVGKLMDRDYRRQTVTIEGKITEFLGGTFYRLVDYNGDYIRFNMAGMGSMVAIEGRITEYMDNDYAQFTDKKGDFVMVKMNTTVIEQDTEIVLYGVPQIANARLEINLDHFEYK